MSSETESSPESEAIEYLRRIYDSENTPIDPQDADISILYICISLYAKWSSDVSYGKTI